MVRERLERPCQHRVAGGVRTSDQNAELVAAETVRGALGGGGRQTQPKRASRASPAGWPNESL